MHSWNPTLTFCFQQLHGETFKKRAPQAIKQIKLFATKSMVRANYSAPTTASGPTDKETERVGGRSGRQGTNSTIWPAEKLTCHAGHHRCPPRPPTEQEGLGAGY